MTLPALPEFTLVSPTPAQQHVLHLVAGSELSPVLLRYAAQPPAQPYALAQRAAHVAVGLLMGQQHAWYESQHPPGAPFARLQPLAGRVPQGRPIRMAELLSPCYDPARQQLRGVFSYEGRTRLSRATALPHVLLNPPHSFRLPHWPTGWDRTPALQAAEDQAHTDLLHAILRELLGVADLADPDAGLLLHTWTTDWHEYFDAGHEWWGSFCWTAHRPATRTITVLLASATD